MIAKNKFGKVKENRLDDRVWEILCGTEKVGFIRYISQNAFSGLNMFKFVILLSLGILPGCLELDRFFMVRVKEKRF